ncbi:MAG: hypothetical protein K8U03_19990 [Planctomycetia bacterium]|nr:hypothetical protein [Planctomycetia bacterium]
MLRVLGNYLGGRPRWLYVHASSGLHISSLQRLIAKQAVLPIVQSPPRTLGPFLLSIAMLLALGPFAPQTASAQQTPDAGTAKPASGAPAPAIVPAPVPVSTEGQAPSPTPPAPAPASPPVPPAITLPAPDQPPSAMEAKPSLYYFLNKGGNLQPVVGFSLEEFEQMIRRRDEAATERRKPDYRFEALAATGTADDRYARIDVKFVVFVDAAGWVRVPLDLQGAVLEKQADYKGPGKFALQFDAERREYAVWLQGAGDQPHEITLKTVTALEQVSGQHRLRLSLPRAWTSSLALAVPEVNVVAQVSTGAVLDSVAAEPKGSRIKASGVGGAFQLTWGVIESASRRIQVLLEAKADVLAVVDARSISYETEMTVNSFGGEFDRFQVQLPPSSVLVEEKLADIEFTQKPPKSKTDRTVVVEVRRISGSAKSMTVKLKALRSLEQSKGGQNMFDFGGFEVLDAVRQWGFLGVVVEGDWQILWGERSRVRQVDAAPEFLRGREGASIFEYYGRPFSLLARLVPRETRVSIDPEYVVDITPKSAFLTAKLKYRVGGAKVFALPIQMLDWQVDEVGPAEIVNTKAVVLGQSDPLTIALLQPSIGDFEIKIRAHRELPADVKSISLALPKPQANVVGPATFTVEAADNVELSPRDSLHTGLTRRKRSDVKSAGGGSSWSYSADSADATFTADVRSLSRRIHVRANSQLTLSREGGQARQTFTYIVTRERLDALEFDVPIRLTDKGRLELKLAGEPISWVVVEEDAGNPNKPARIRVHLPTARLGTFDITASYPIPEEQAVAQASVALRIPLLAPVDGELDENELRIVEVPGLTIQHFDETWRKAPDKQDTTTGARRELVLRSAAAGPETMLGVRWDDPAPTNDALVERLWIQTIMMGSVRQERAVFRFTSSAPTVELRLPAGATGATATVNGSIADFAEPISQRSLVLRLPANAREREFVLDLRYRVVATELGPWATFDPPTIEHVAAVRNVYRQVALVADQYLLDASDAYVPEYTWTWDGIFLVRRPPLSQADLENWCGARHETPLPERANVYLFSSFGAAPEFSATTVRRTVIVLGASGIVLVYCLCLLYFTWLRHPALLILLAIGVAAGGAMFPGFAPIAIQGATLGAVLAFTALLLDRNFVRRHGRAVPRKNDSGSAVPGSSARTKITAAFVPPPASTAAIDIPVSASGSGTSG